MSTEPHSGSPGSQTDEAPLDEKLRFAAQDLSSPMREDREAAERTLLQAKLDAIPYLVEALEAPPPPFGEKQVGRIALLLGAMRARDALEALFKQAQSDDLNDDHRAFIARALAEILDGRDAFDDRARAALEDLVSSPDRYTRAFAAKAFGQLGDERSLARVKALCSDGDDWVRTEAQRVMAAHEQASLADDEPDLDDFAQLVSDANAKGGDLAAWLSDLGDSRRAVRDTAVKALIKAGSRSVPHLIDVLNQPRTRPKIGAATVLGRLQAPEAVAPLVITATGAGRSKEEKELVPICLRSLANCITGEEDGVAESLLGLAKDDDRFIRAGALLCLGRLQDRRGLPLIVDALSDKDPFVVESASIALSEGAREADVDLVLPLLLAFDAPRKRDPQVLAEAILIALARIHVEHPGLRVRVRHRVRRELRAKTAAARKAAIALLEELYAQDDPPPLPLVDEVLLALRDRHPEVRVVAASFLSRHLFEGFTGASKHLKEAIFKNERTLALLCVEALRRLNTPDARSTLEALTAYEDTAIATRAAELLDGWTTQTSEWVFEKKSTLPSSAPSSESPSLPKRKDATKPSRVRGVSDGNADIVEAKDSPDDHVVEAKDAGAPDVVEAKISADDLDDDIVEAKDAPTADVVEAKAPPTADVVEAKDAPNDDGSSDDGSRDDGVVDAKDPD